jgi:hypothetical protein
MAYDVTKTNQQRLAIIPDRQLDSTSTSLKLLGKNFPSYGEVMAENLVALLEHFSNPTAPPNPIIGQLWYKSTEDVLYVNATGTADGWFPIGGKNTIGGPATGFETSAIKDENNLMHSAIKVKVNSVIVAIISSDAAQYIPHADTGLQGRFPLIGAGITMNDGDSDPTAGDFANFLIRGRSLEAEFADMAEIYIADDLLVPGNIVKLGGEQEITKTTQEFDDQVFGIISTAPGFLLNSKMKMADYAYPVALKGRVPCVVKGPVKKGQRIVASDIPGVGMATDQSDSVSVVGRAISAKHDDSIGAVEVAVGVK